MALRASAPLLRNVLARSAPRAAVAAPSFARAAAAAPSVSASARWAPSFQVRGYGASSGLSNQEIQNRIVEVLKSFEKVDPSKVANSSSFTSDLGLDSLDAVEVVMAIEEEFSIEIPDPEADNITTVQQAIDYIAKTPEAH